MFRRIFLPGNETPYALRTICGVFRSEVSLSMALPQAMHPHGDGDSTKAEVPWLCFGAEKYAWGVPTYPNTIDILVFKDVETCWNIEKWHAVDSISEMTAVSGRRRKLCWVAAFEWPRRRHLGPHHAFWVSAGSVSDVSGVATGLQSLQVESREMEWSKVQLEFQPACHALHAAIYVLLHRVNRNGLAQNGIYQNLSNLTKKRVLRETSRMIFTFVFVRKFWEHPSKKHKSHGFKNHKVITKMEGTFARKPWYWLVKLMISCRLTDYPNDFTK